MLPVFHQGLFCWIRANCVFTCMSTFCQMLSGIFFFNYPWNSFVFHYTEFKSFCPELGDSFQFTKGVLALFPPPSRTPPPLLRRGADTLYCIIPPAPFAHCSPSLICLDWYSVFHRWQLFFHFFHTFIIFPLQSQKDSPACFLLQCLYFSQGTCCCCGF